MASHYNLRSRSNKAYVYSPLETSEPTIRLLEVLPTLTRGQLSLAVKHVSLADAKEQYHTISYTWGNDEPSHRVYVDSQYLLLRDSIWSFLMHYYKTRSAAHRWLWIDSICINQSDIAEKNQQVSMMGQIFRESYGTLIWLNLLSMQGPFVTSFQSYWSKVRKNIEDEERSRLLDIFLYGSVGLKIRENRKTMRPGALQLFRHDYWRRLWVVQEIILSQRISIIVGRTVINLDLILRSVYDSIPFNQSHISGVFEDEYLDYTLQRYLTNRMCSVEERQSLSLSLLSLVSEYGAHGCKDIRDRVYGLLALTYEPDRVTVDYNCHIVALFAETLKSCVANLEDFGPKRENIHMHDIQGLMRALHVGPDVLLEYQKQESTAQKFPDCFKIHMFPTVVYIVASRHNKSTFLRLIDENDKSINLNLRGHADRQQDDIHMNLLAEIHNLKPFDTGARYLLCDLSLSGFQALLRVHSTSNVALVGTLERTGKANTEGNLLSLCAMPSHVLKSINVELNGSRTEFHRAAFKQKVKWPGYVIRCSVEELVHLQGSHDRLNPEYFTESEYI